MKKQTTKLLLTIILTIVSLNLVIATPLYYSIELESNFNKISINTIDIVFNQFDKGNYYDPDYKVHNLEIVDFTNNILSTTSFSIPDFAIFDLYDEDTDEIISGGIENLDQIDFNLLVPYNENAKELIIYNEQNQEVTKSSLAQYSNSPKAQEFLQTTEKEEIPDSIPETKPETSPSKQDSNLGWKILLGILFILVMVFITLIFKKKKK